MFKVNVTFPFKWSKKYTYLSDRFIKNFTVVQAEIGKVISIGITVPGEVCQNEIEYKKITKIYSFSLPKNIYYWMVKVADYNLLSFGEVLNLILQKNLQAKALGSYFNKNEELISIYELLKQFKSISLRKLIRLGDIFSTCIPNPSSKCNLSLTSDQLLAIQAVKFHKFQIYFLQGVTGSGKTDVYFEMIYQIWLQKKKILVLLPEVALIDVWLQRFFDRFKVHSHVWHSKCSAFLKNIIWHWAIKEEPGVIVGARSALWLPYKNLGCIIIDEEHDSSYKQNTNSIYHARDMAILLAKQYDIPIILVSATPSLESCHQIKNRSYQLLRLSRRENTQVPVEIIKLKNSEWMSDKLKYKIIDNLKKGEQSLLFINRRGFASTILCSDCYTCLYCDFCSSSLSYHYQGWTHCSFCLNKASLPKQCKNCQGTKWKFFGIGVEKVLLECKKMFSKAKIAMLSSDISANEFKKYLYKISQNEIDIIIATQIFSKGYHFENLTLVGILQGDFSNYSLDPRYSERMYQLLTQVKGRCGRGDKPSQVLIQVQKDNQSFELLKKANYNLWAKNELLEREKYDLPPYYRLINIIISAPSALEAEVFAKKLRDAWQNTDFITIYGPTATPLHKYKNSFRQSILLTCKRGFIMQPIVKKWLQSIALPNKIQILVDVDPHNFF